MIEPHCSPALWVAGMKYHFSRLMVGKITFGPLNEMSLHIAMEKMSEQKMAGYLKDRFLGFTHDWYAYSKAIADLGSPNTQNLRCVCPTMATLYYDCGCVAKVKIKAFENIAHRYCLTHGEHHGVVIMAALAGVTPEEYQKGFDLLRAFYMGMNYTKIIGLGGIEGDADLDKVPNGNFMDCFSDFKIADIVKHYHYITSQLELQDKKNKPDEILPLPKASYQVDLSMIVNGGSYVVGGSFVEDNITFYISSPDTANHLKKGGWVLMIDKDPAHLSYYISLTAPSGKAWSALYTQDYISKNSIDLHALWGDTIAYEYKTSELAYMAPGDDIHLEITQGRYIHHMVYAVHVNIAVVIELKWLEDFLKSNPTKISLKKTWITKKTS